MEKIKRFGVAAVILLLTMAMLPISDVKAETQSIPSIEDPTPGYWETSEYMIGNCSVSIIFVESNGIIDPETENWTTIEINNVRSEIENATNWWSTINPNASFSIYTEYCIAETGYEAINHTEAEAYLWIRDIMNSKGYENVHWPYQVRDYVNAFRDSHNTDWCFVIFVVDSSNDPDGMFREGGYAKNSPGGTYLYMTYDNSWHGIENMDRVTAHEMGSIFWAIDEYVPIADYGGYLNVTSIPLSGCIMDNMSWCLSGAPHGHNGTWGQVGWRDSDGDGIQDIVDTFPTISFDSEIIGNTISCNGTASVTPYPNKNPSTNWYQRNITINKIQNIKFRVDYGDWFDATITDSYKQAVVNLTFLTPELEPGDHFIEVKATNQWGNSGYANETVTIPELVNDIALVDVIPGKTVVCQNYSMNINVTVENQGDVTETFNVTLYANTTIVETKEITLTSGNSTTITFNWNTTGFPLGNYTMKAIADQVPGEIDTVDNTFADGTVKLTIVGDVNGDKIVDIFDCVIIALAFGSIPDNPNWNSNADINNDNIIDIFDLVLVATHYGETCP